MCRCLPSQGAAALIGGIVLLVASQKKQLLRPPGDNSCEKGDSQCYWYCLSFYCWFWEVAEATTVAAVGVPVGAQASGLAPYWWSSW